MSNWWDSYEDHRPVNYPRRDDGKAVRVAVTTDPEMYRNRNGALSLRLVNRHPHTAVRIFTTQVGCASR